MLWIVAEDAQEPTYQGKTFKDIYLPGLLKQVFFPHSDSFPEKLY